MPQSLPVFSLGRLSSSNRVVRIPALSELPMISVVHPAYHAFPNGGNPSFCPCGNRRFSCVRVLATASCIVNGSDQVRVLGWRVHSAGYVIAGKGSDCLPCSGACRRNRPISTAPAVDPAMIDRNALGLTCKHLESYSSRSSYLLLSSSSRCHLSE